MNETESKKSPIKKSMSIIDNDLKKAETLMDEGKDYEAIPILNKLIETSTLSLSDEIILSSLLIRVGDWENTFKIADQVYQKAQDSQDYLQSIIAILNMANAVIILGDLDKSSKLLEKSEEIYSLISKNNQANLEEVEAYKAYIKGRLFFFSGNKEESLKYMRRSLELREKIGKKRDIAESLLGLSNIYRLLDIDFDKAFDYTNQCLRIAKELPYQRLIASSHFNLGFTSYLKGELEKALSYYELAFSYFEKTNNSYYSLGVWNNLALVYRAQGKLDKSVELLNKCIKLSDKLENNWSKVGYNVSMVEILLDKGDIENAKKYSERVKQMRDIEKTPYINRDYTYTEALILKKSPRTQNRAKAENLLRSLIQDENTVSEIKIEGLIHLCDLLINELKLTQEIEIVKEIKPLIKQLLLLTEKSQSYWYYAETYVLQARLALLTLDIKIARQLLTKAQYIAEKHSFDPLVKKISSEHDELLQKLDIWEELKDSDSNLSDRLKLANLDEHIKFMIQKRRNGIPDIAEEKPIMILVISEGGIPTFSKLFAETFIIEDDLISGFLKAFNTFSGEIFSEGLDRASFGQFTLLMKPLSTFLVCYLFKGQTLSAQRKMKVFVENLEQNKQLLEKFNEYYKSNQVIKMEDLPSLNSLITEIFMQKNIG